MTVPPFNLPEGFRFGVATAGFQVEGGFNGPGQPRNNWYRWEASGRIEPSGIALDFWNRYEEQLDRAVAAGCDAFRLSVEWARCEPAEGEIDAKALDHYAAILDACRDRGLQPVVTLHHFTHPAWLGEDFWLHGHAPERFASWARIAVGHLMGRCQHWVTINEMNILAMQSYFAGTFPPGRLLAAGDAVRALDHMLTAHVLTYREIHHLQPGALVAPNNYAFSIYELDRLLTDLLLARRYQVDRQNLREWLTDRRSSYYASLPSPPLADLFFRRLVATLVPLDRALPRAVAAIYESPHLCTLDVAQFDYYDPIISHHLRLPGHRTAGGRNWLPGRLLWDEHPNPGGLVEYSRLNHEPGMQVWIVENGMCNRVNGRSYQRLDGWDRVRYLQANLAAVVRAIDIGIPLGSYFHWTLGDNYEWGSYQPRFGLYGVDRRHGIQWSHLDSMGKNAAGAFRRIVEGLRAGDRSVLGMIPDG